MRKPIHITAPWPTPEEVKKRYPVSKARAILHLPPSAYSIPASAGSPCCARWWPVRRRPSLPSSGTPPVCPTAPSPAAPSPAMPRKAPDSWLRSKAPSTW